MRNPKISEITNVKKSTKSMSNLTPALRKSEMATKIYPERIEKIDLSNDRDRDDYAKLVPRDYRKLQLLHSSVNRGPPVSVIKKTKPALCNVEKPVQTSFSPGSATILEPINVISSDYDDSGMDDLPSPSTILGARREIMEPLSIQAKPRDSAYLAPQDETPANEPGSGELGERASFHGRAIDILDVELMDEETSAEKQPCLPLGATLFPNQGPDIKDSDPLFCGTDSPEKLSTSDFMELEAYLLAETQRVGKRKRALSSTPEVSGLEGSHSTQKRRTSTPKSEQRCQIPDTAAELSQVHFNIKPPVIRGLGRPQSAWVDDFDPGFIAEYADFVEFA